MSNTSNPVNNVPASVTPALMDIVVIGVIEAVKAQFSFMTHVVACRREAMRIAAAQPESQDESTTKSDPNVTAEAVPLNPLRLLIMLLRRQGLSGVVQSTIPLVLGKLAVELNIRLAGTLVGICLPPHFAPEGVIGSVAFVSLINTLMIPAIAPVSLMSVKKYGILPTASKNGNEAKGSLIGDLSTVPVRRWYAKAWMIPLGDLVKQVSLRLVVFGFDGLLQRLLGFPRLVTFATIFTVGQAVAYPIQLVYHRYLMALGTPQEYRGIRDVATTVRNEGGIGAFFDGFGYTAFGSLLTFFSQ